ncbi:MAG: DUF4093 domain-containing protein [Ruminococcaceae bacterium]|nr:DUF4093 domain-containing protein [Oscillospiraceae bacterium]
MIKLKEAVVVEGRYDAVKLDSVIDGLIITTEGFNIFKDKAKAELIRKLAMGDGIIVLTDNDSAGFKIRKHISDIAAGGRVLHAYVPEIMGKEKRKSVPGKEGIIGVEGVDGARIEKALREAMGGEEYKETPEKKRITLIDLYEDGLNGGTDSERRRNALKEKLGIPRHLSTKAFLEVLNRLCGYEEYKRLVSNAQDNS